MYLYILTNASINISNEKGWYQWKVWKIWRTILLGTFQSLCERIRAKVSHIFMEEYWSVENVSSSNSPGWFHRSTSFLDLRGSFYLGGLPPCGVKIFSEKSSTIVESDLPYQLQKKSVLSQRELKRKMSVEIDPQKKCHCPRNHL